MTDTPDTGAAAEPLRHRALSPFWRGVMVAVAVATLVLTVNQIFNLQFLVGYVLLENQYLYYLAALMLPAIFVIFPATAAGKTRPVPWWDVLLAIATFAVAAYMGWVGEVSVSEGWEYVAPDEAMIAAFVLWGLLLEAVRRSGGVMLLVLVTLFSLYPPVADQVPGPIQGYPQPIDTVASFYAYSVEAIFGIPMKAFGELVIGFVIFGVALQHTGAGRFFIDLAFALLGHVRGGAAKVAIFSSGLLGSMSGSVITNVLTTGVMTIPAMKRTGFSRHFAAGVEACASTGGVLMPPVMGATAFVMASFLNIPYVEVAVAAIIPSALYYLGLFLQIDAYAARHGLKGVERTELPPLGPVLRAGWHYIFAFALLVWMLLFLKREATAPFYATVVLLVTNQIFGRRLDLRECLDLLKEVAMVLAELVALLCGVGLIVGALVVTGLAGTIATDLVHLAGGSVLLLLLMGAITSFILGMGMTVTAAYIFLAIVLAPALIRGGLDPLAVHMFIFYWGMLSFITPPVALGAFAAATLAGSDPMRAGFAAMKLGSIIYFIPFFFALNPSLILHGAPGEIVVVLATAVLGVGLIAGAVEGWLLGWGRLAAGSAGLPGRALLFLGGLLFAYPGGEELPLSHVELAALAAAVALVGLVADGAVRRLAPSPT